MKTLNFLDAQKAFIMKQGDDGMPFAKIRRKAGINQSTYFVWRKKHAALLPGEMRRGRNSGSEPAGPRSWRRSLNRAGCTP